MKEAKSVMLQLLLQCCSGLSLYSVNGDVVRLIIDADIGHQKVQSIKCGLVFDVFCDDLPDIGMLEITKPVVRWSQGKCLIEAKFCVPTT